MVEWSKYGAAISTVSLAIALYSIYFPNVPIMGGNIGLPINTTGDLVVVAFVAFFIGLAITFRKQLKELW